MDLHLLRTPASPFNNGERFTVRSASSPSYGLSRRPGIRKARAPSQEEKTGGEIHADVTATADYWAVAGKPSSLRGPMSATVQQEGSDKSGRLKATNITWSGSADKTSKDVNTDLSNGPQHVRGRADWRSFNISSRSKSLDWRTGSKSPDRFSRLTDKSVSASDQYHLRGRDVNASRGRVVSSIETFNSTRESVFLPRSPTARSLDMLSRGHSVPTRLKSPSQSVFRSNSSLGTRGGQSILERIEKLYGANAGKMEEDSRFRDFSGSDSKGQSSAFHFEGFIGDSYRAPRRRSLEVTHGTFPRRLSAERNVQSSIQSRNFLTMTPHMDAHRYSFDSSLSLRGRGVSERAPEYQSHMFTKYPWDDAVKGDGVFIKTGTQSLDRARSRNTIAGQIRSNRFTFPQPAFDDTSCKSSVAATALSINSTTGPGNVETKTEKVGDQLEGKSAKTDLIRNTEPRFSSTDDVFESETQNRELKPLRRKAFSVKTDFNSAASVRNKINQFEAMTQRGSGQGLMQRRAFSVPTQHNGNLDGVKKSGSVKAIDCLRDKWEGLAEGREAGNKPEEKAASEETKLKSEKGEEASHGPTDENIVVCSEQKQGLDIPLNNSTQDGQMDETDFSKSSSPADDRVVITTGSPVQGAGVAKQPAEVTSPSSDLDKTPTNTPKLSPALSADKAAASAFPNNQSSFTFPESHDSPAPLHPLAASSRSNIPELISPEREPTASKPLSDLETWVSNWNSEIKVWNDDDTDDDESTQKDGDSNYDSDSGESSITITSNISQSDNRSFSVSLSDLYSFAGVDCESENDSEEWKSVGRRSASLSSDMSALSYVSVLPTEELDRLIEDVKGLGENSLQDDVHVVVLHKDVGVGLGFSLAGGVDQNKLVTVHRVFHTGVAAQEGSVQEGDQVLSINGTALSGCAHWEALRVLRRAKAREMGVVVLRKGGSVSKKGIQAKPQGPAETSPMEIAQQVCVRLEKNNRDLGFSLEGGSGLENRPLTVQKIFQGGPFDKVHPGDELLEVEGVSMVGMRRLEAWTLIRRLPPGPVDVVLSRPMKRQEI
ncbi:uncharacterized protein ACB058_020055 isoform 1-T2 [Synchiropus picturatus]